MADSDAALSPQAISPPAQSPEKEETKELNESLESSPLSNSPKEGEQPQGARIKISCQDLDESQSELLSKIQGLKQNVQGWRTMVDTQVKSYKDELLGLKQQLETELEQLSSDFTELKTTLQKQQEDVTNSLKNLGLQYVPKLSGESEIENKEDTLDKAQEPTSENKNEKQSAEDSST